MELQAYTVYGKNSVGTTMTTINIQVKKGECLADGVFPKTPVGTVAEYQCSSQGSYVGTQKRACVLGATNGEWMKATGFCMSMALIVILIFIVIVVIVLVVRHHEFTPETVKHFQRGPVLRVLLRRFLGEKFP